MSITNSATPSVVAKKELAIADQHRLLASEQRRRILDLLEENITPIELETLASKVAIGGNDSVKVTTISLHHLHLPMMDEMDVIDYDPDDQIVRPSV